MGFVETMVFETKILDEAKRGYFAQLPRSTLAIRKGWLLLAKILETGLPFDLRQAWSVQCLMSVIACRYSQRSPSELCSKPLGPYEHPANAMQSTPELLHTDNVSPAHHATAS